MPAYNAEKTIRQAILSVMCSQSNSAIDLIVIDDGSTDRTPEILRELQEDLHFRVITQENAGPGAARNVGLKQAIGRVVTFLDADDYFEPKALGRMRTCMLRYNVNACIAETRYRLGRMPLSSSIECWHKPNDPVISVWENNFLVEITPGIRAKMFKREILDGLVFSESKWEDLALIPVALARAGEVVILDEPVYNYRIHLNTTVKDFLFQCRATEIFEPLGILKQNLASIMLDNTHNIEMMKMYKSILTLHTVFRMQNVMTWVDASRVDKTFTIRALEEILADEYLHWREDPVLCDPEWGYRNMFFRWMLQRLYKMYLD